MLEKELKGLKSRVLVDLLKRGEIPETSAEPLIFTVAARNYDDPDDLASILGPMVERSNLLHPQNDPIELSIEGALGESKSKVISVEGLEKLKQRLQGGRYEPTLFRDGEMSHSVEGAQPHTQLWRVVEEWAGPSKVIVSLVHKFDVGDVFADDALLPHLSPDVRGSGPVQHFLNTIKTAQASSVPPQLLSALGDQEGLQLEPIVLGDSHSLLELFSMYRWESLKQDPRSLLLHFNSGRHRSLIAMSPGTIDYYGNPYAETLKMNLDRNSWTHAPYNFPVLPHLKLEIVRNDRERRALVYYDDHNPNTERSYILNGAAHFSRRLGSIADESVSLWAIADKA